MTLRFVIKYTEQTMVQPKLLLLTIVTLLLDFSVLAKRQDSLKIESRIVNGQDAVRGQFPYYVFIEIQMPQLCNVCGGSLISSEWILTAGHCLENATVVQVHLGSLSARNKNEVGREMFNVRKWDLHIHPKYSEEFTLKLELFLISNIICII